MRIIGLDSETYLFYAGNMAPPIVCVTCADDKQTVLVRREDGLDLFERVLADEECVIAGANIAYDFICAAAHRPEMLTRIFKAYDQGRVWDILIGEALHDILFGQLFRDPITLKPFERYSQSLVEQRLLGIDRRDQKHGENVWRVRYGELDPIATELWPPEAIQYPKDDAYLVRECARKQIERGSNAHCMEEQARAALALHLSRVWGIRTDPETVKSVVAEVTAVHVETLRKFTELGIYRPDGTKDTAALAKRVALAYGARDLCTDCHGSGKASSVKTGKPVVCTKCWGTGLDISSVPLTDTGRVSTDRDTLQESGDDHLEEFATTGQNEKWFSTYLPVLQLGTERPINAETNVLVVTGRTSYRHPNLQNLPRKGRIRECFAARPGHVFGTIDYGGLELVTLAQVCLWWVGGSKLAEAINEGKDVHSLFGAMLLNISFEEFEHRLHKQKDKQAKSFRQLAKCFHPDTQILTRERGWVCIGDVTMEDEVAAAIPDNGKVTIEWQHPTALTHRPCVEGELVHLKNEGMDLRVTADHRMLVRAKTGKHQVVRPEEVNVARNWWNAGTYKGGTRVVDERLLRLAVATQADGSYSGQRIRFGFSKQRKINRLHTLLHEGEYDKGIYTNGKNQPTTFFHLDRVLSRQIKDLLEPNKTLPWWWLDLTEECRQIVLDEASYWDAHQQDNWRMYQYYTTLEQNVDVLQALASITGRKTRSVRQKPNKVGHAPSLRMTVRAKDRDCTRGGNLKTTKIPYTGDVVCLSVPASFVLVRDGGVPVITGQCPNFGLPGGLGAGKLVAYGRQSYGARFCELAGVADKCGENKVIGRDGRPVCSKCLEVATDMRQKWFEFWPEVREYHAIVKRLTEGPNGGDVQVPGPVGPGMPGLGLTRGQCGFCDGANNGFQGLAARGAKAAYYEVTKECYTNRDSPLWGTRPLIFIHDEIIPEIPEARGHEAAYRISEIMVATMRRFTPDVRVTAPPALMKRWFKGAEPVHECRKHGKPEKKWLHEERCCADARLVPWWPK